MKILVGYDGSDVAKEALNVASAYAKAFECSVDIVTSMLKGTDDQTEEIKKAERGLEYAESFFKQKNIDCRTHLLIRGLTPGEDIVKYAGEQKVDQVIVGVKRRSKVGKLLMGSTAQYVILNANCPVVSVK